MQNQSVRVKNILSLIVGRDAEVVLQNRTLNGICFACLVVFASAVPLSLFLNTPREFTLAYLIFALIYSGFYLMTRFLKAGDVVIWLMTIACGVYICFLWFYDGGMSGSAAMLSLLVVILISPIPNTLYRRIFLFMILLLQGGLYFVQYHYPDLVSAYQNLGDQIVANYCMFVFVALITMALVNYILKNLRAEREQNIATKQRLKESEYLFRMLSETTATAIVLCKKGKIDYANPAARSLYAYSLDELKMMAFHHLLIPEDREKIAQRLIEKASGEKIISGLEAKIITGNREIRPVYIEASTIDYSGYPAILISMIDLTRLKKAETDLLHLQSYLSDIINSMPSILIGVDAALNVNQWNRMAEIQTGITTQDAFGNPVFSLLPRLEKESMTIRQALFAKEIRENIRLIHERNGQMAYEELTVFPLKSGSVDGAVIRLDEVTEKVRLEEMIIQSEKMLSIGGLAAGMAHEINNPLAGILQNVQLAKNRLDMDIPANTSAAEKAGTSMAAIRGFMGERKIFDQLDNIENAGSQAAKIVENMLSFAKKGMPKQQHQPSKLLQRAVDLAMSDYHLKKKYNILNIKITQEFSPRVSMVYCEENKLIQVFYNIISNAVHAMHSIQEPEHSPRLVLRLFNRNEKVWIEFEDNGPGMDEHIRKRIFEPFFTTKEVDEGTGLGLSLSYFIIVKDHAGEMEVDSVPGKGSRFVIRLPFAA